METLKDLIKKFITQSQKGESQAIKHYPKHYEELRVRVSFGRGSLSFIPWIAFLGPDQEGSNGIYPVILYYKKRNVLILAYGVSEDNIPKLEWEFGNEKVQTIQDYFQNEFGVNADRYGKSYVALAQSVDEINYSQLSDSIKKLIGAYKILLQNIGAVFPFLIKQTRLANHTK